MVCRARFSPCERECHDIDIIDNVTKEFKLETSSTSASAIIYYINILVHQGTKGTRHKAHNTLALLDYEYEYS